MLRFAADENFNNDILRGLRRHYPEIDIEIAGEADSVVLEWSAKEKRLLLTHDRKTIPPLFYERVKAALPMPGVVLVNLAVPIGQLIEELSIIVGASDENEWNSQIIYIPMK